MNTRERFLATMAFEPVDRVPLWDYEYWPETIRMWRGNGAPLQHQEDEPETSADKALHDDFDYPHSISLFANLPLEPEARVGFTLDPTMLRIPLNSFICPLFEYRVLDVQGDVVIAQDRRGHIRRDKKDRASISNIIKPLVENRDDWETVKAERLALSMEGRLPQDWPEVRERLKERNAPLAIGGAAGMSGFYHSVRYLMGPEHLLYSFHDQPELVRDIMNHLAHLYTFLYDRLLSEISVDLAFFNEDFAFKTGPFISPDMFREFVLPCYKRITGMLRDHGVKIIFVDSDGNNWKLIPMLLEGGVTCLGPMEVAASMDVIKLREAFPRLQMIGGIDKRSLIAGPGAIDQELEHKVLPLLKTGGYVPTVDHGVPPDVSWENYTYYRMRVEEMVRNT